MSQFTEKTVIPFCHTITISNAKTNFLGNNNGKSVSFQRKELNDLGEDFSETLKNIYNRYRSQNAILNTDTILITGVIALL